MRAPKGVSAAARAAYVRATKDLDERGVDRAVLQDAIDRYVFAVDLADRLRKQWESMSRPLVGLGGATGSAEVPHPLVAMMSNADRDAARHAVALGLDLQSAAKLSPRNAGRPMGNATALDRAPTGAAAEPPRIRRVK